MRVSLQQNNLIDDVFTLTVSRYPPSSSDPWYLDVPLANIGSSTLQRNVEVRLTNKEIPTVTLLVLTFLDPKDSFTINSQPQNQQKASLIFAHEQEAEQVIRTLAKPMITPMNQDATKVAALSTKASQALEPLDVSQETKSGEKSEDKACLRKCPFKKLLRCCRKPSTKPPQNHKQSPQDLSDAKAKNGEPGKRPALQQLELSPAAKRPTGLKSALRYAKDDPVKNKDTLNRLESSNTASNALLDIEKRSNTLRGEETPSVPIVDQDTEMVRAGHSDSRNNKSSSAPNSCKATTPRASVHSTRVMASPENKIRHGKCPSFSSHASDETPTSFKPRMVAPSKNGHITALAPSEDIEPGFEPTTAIKVSHALLRSPGTPLSLITPGVDQGANESINGPTRGLRHKSLVERGSASIRLWTMEVRSVSVTLLMASIQSKTARFSLKIRLYFPCFQLQRRRVLLLHGRHLSLPPLRL